MQTILYPRLVLALAARTSLHVAHQAAYERLLDGIRSLGLGRGYQLIAPRPAVTVSAPAADEAAPRSAATTGGPEKGGPTSETDEPALEATAAAPAIFTPLQASLRTLTASLAVDPVLVLETTTFSSPTTPLRPSHALQSSLTALSDYLAAETLASISSAYRTQVPSPSGAGKDQKALQDAVANLKAEIRQVKGPSTSLGWARCVALWNLTDVVRTGALLNRRNFAALVPRAAPVAAGS